MLVALWRRRCQSPADFIKLTDVALLKSAWPLGEAVSGGLS